MFGLMLTYEEMPFVIPLAAFSEAAIAYVYTSKNGNGET